MIDFAPLESEKRPNTIIVDMGEKGDRDGLLLDKKGQSFRTNLLKDTSSNLSLNTGKLYSEVYFSSGSVIFRMTPDNQLVGIIINAETDEHSIYVNAKIPALANESTLVVGEKFKYGNTVTEGSINEIIAVGQQSSDPLGKDQPNIATKYLHALSKIKTKVS